jgi:hypothetical protein
MNMNLENQSDAELQKLFDELMETVQLLGDSDDGKRITCLLIAGIVRDELHRRQEASRTEAHRRQESSRTEAIRKITKNMLCLTFVMTVLTAVVALTSLDIIKPFHSQQASLPPSVSPPAASLAPFIPPRSLLHSQ